MFRKLSVVVVFCLLVTGAALPLFAQTPTPDPRTQVVVVGAVDLGQGVIMVNNYILAPASAFQPSILQQGDDVVVIGYLLPDGVTIQVTSLEFFDDSTPAPIDVTPEPTVEVTIEPIVEVTMEPTAEVTVEPTVEVTAEPTMIASCNQMNQPVAQRLADSFGVSYAEIINWHCEGFGFGEIARAYLLADASGDSAADYFAMREAGEGWGQIVHETGVHPSDLAPGQVIRRGNNAADETTDDAGSEQPGNGNGRGNNGNNGNNGNHGNNGNNGNGNGNGNGKHNG